MRRIVMFQGTACHAMRRTYSGGGTAIQLFDAETGDPVAIATVWLSDVKDYSENEGMYEALVGAGIVKQAPWGVAHGYAVSPLCELIAPVPEENQFWEAVSVPAHKEG